MVKYIVKKVKRNDIINNEIRREQKDVQYRTVYVL